MKTKQLRPFLSVAALPIIGTLLKKFGEKADILFELLPERPGTSM